MRTSEVLNKAADLIEERGWTQGPDGWRESGPVCALGSIGAALGWRSIGANYCPWEVAETPAVAALAHHLEVPVGKDGQGVYRWNDALDRTAEEVIATLRAAALVESAREAEVAETPVHA